MSLLKRIGGTAPAGGAAPPANSEPAAAPAAPARRDEAAKAHNATAQEKVAELRIRIQKRLADELDVTRLDTNNMGRVRHQVEELFKTIVDGEGAVLSRAERQTLLDAIISDITGYGPLELLLSDDSISEIMVNGPHKIYVERKGRVTKSEVTFSDDEHLMRVLQRIVSPLGRRVDESSPMVDARLPNGSRVNAVIRPISLIGPVISIRKFSKKPLTYHDLIRFGSITQDMVDFLSACVKARLNAVVSGGTGSGKTTLLNMLSSFIPEDERVITIENAAELQLQIDHWIPLETRPPNIEGK